MLLGVLLLLSLSSALLTIYPPADAGLDPFPFYYIEGDFCSAAKTLTNVPLVYVENTVGPCDNISLPSSPSIAGKIVFSPVSYCQDCCPLPPFVKALQQAGAIGFVADSAENIKLTGALTTQQGLFCYGLSYSDFISSDDLVAWLTAGEDVTVDVFQPPLDPQQRAVLVDTQSRAGVSVWDVNGDPCAGTASVPPSRITWKGVTCDVNGLVTQLTLPFPIGQTGKFPDSFCAMSSLTSLIITDDATFTSFQFCSNFTALVLLTISGTSMNQFDDRIFGLKIISLDLSNNQLTGSLNFSKWSPTYRTLILRGNSFNGSISIPNPIKWNFLGSLLLAQNNFTGQFPDLSNMTRLVQLDLTDNMFTSMAIPSKNYALAVLRLGYNNFTTIPDAFFRLIPNVGEITLAHNQLTSIVAFSTVRITKPFTLDISSNQITGLLNIANSNMTSCLASNNSITGLPGAAGDYNLAKLDLTNNNVSGAFNLVFKNLRYLYMSGNQITSFPFSTFAQLLTADVSNNAFSSDLSTVTVGGNLYSLDLSNNQLTGAVPVALYATAVQLRLAGNPRLSHGSASLLPPRIVFTWSVTQTFEELNMECPTYFIQDVLQSEFTVDPSYHENKLCRCLPNFYREPNSTSCSPCLLNAVCPGKEDPLSVENNANILAKFGYFPLPNPENPVMFIPCRFGVILVNDPLNPCNPNVNALVMESQSSERNVSVAATRFQCSVGYTDRLCSRCEPGWFRKEGRCLICNGRPEYPLFLIAIVCIFLGACTFFAYRQPVDMSTTSINPDGWTFEPKQRVYDFVPLILHFFQVSTIILVKLQSLDVVQTMNSLLVTASFSTPQSGIGFECGLPVFQGFVTQYLAVVIFPPMLAIVLAAFFGARIIIQYYKRQTQNWSLHLYQYFYGLFSMFEAIHFPLVTYVLGVFQCTKDPISGISYFTDHPYLLCSSISPAGKVFPLLLYPIGLVGFFVCLGVYLHYAPSDVKESEPIIQSFAFFYIRFKPDRVASGVFFIFLNLGLSLVVGLMEPNNDVFPTAIVLLLIVDFFFVTVFQPYLQPRYNKVRTVNDLVALLLFVNNLIYSSGDQFPGRSASPAVVYVGLNLGMICFYAYHLYRIVKIHRTDLRLMRANSGVVDPHHRGDTRKHIELGELKSRKHTNIDPPSTSHEVPTHTGHGSSGSSHVYVPVTTNPPASATENVEASSHSPLPIISEHESSDFAVSPKTTTDGGSSGGGGLIFTENPLAETGATFSGETPPSPSSKD